jgi:hypothetical protein
LIQVINVVSAQEMYDACHDIQWYRRGNCCSCRCRLST